MTKEQLFESLNSIDDELILRSEKASPKTTGIRQVFFKISAAAAAGIIIFTGACFGIYKASNIVKPDFKDNITTTPTTTMPMPTTTTTIPATTISEPEWSIHYNKINSMTAKLMDIALYSNPLSMDNLKLILPDVLAYPSDYGAYSGHAFFAFAGGLRYVALNVQTAIPESNVHIQVSNLCYHDLSCYILDCNKTESIYGDTSFYLYSYECPDSISLYADTERDGVYYHFSMNVSHNNYETGKNEFEAVIKSFSNNGKGVKAPDLSIITPIQIPEYKNEILSLEEALSDQTFGRYMLTEIPGGYQTEAIRRYIDQHSNLLSGLWTHGYDSLSWRVSYLDSMDTVRITDVADTANYDLALYPIPRAESVPDELREIVYNPIFKIEELTLDVIYKRAYTVNDAGDSDGYRMNFSVLYDDIIVEINTKGISPEWLYEQLTGLIKQN